jgi:hypothetical protein
MRMPSAALAAASEHAWPAGSIFGLLALGWLLQIVTGTHFLHPFQSFLAGKLFLLIASCFAGVVIYEVGRAWAGRPRGSRTPLAAFKDVRATRLAPARILRFILSAGLVALLFDVHGQWKNAIPLFHGFSWDGSLADWDRLVHGGREPWALLQPLLGTPETTATLDLVYQLWVPLIPIVVTWQCWQEDALARRRFLLAFTWTWIALGVGLAHAFASAGPCYFGLVTGDGSRYAAMVDYLAGVDRTIPLASHAGQRALWALYASGHTTTYTGISAMPSLHVAMPVLYTLAAWERHRRLAIVFAAFALLVSLASVHLGWHYALDGEVAIAGVIAVWWAAGRIVAHDVRPANAPDA